MEKYDGRLLFSCAHGEYLVGKTLHWVVRVQALEERRMSPKECGQSADTAEYCRLFAKRGRWSSAVMRVCPEAEYGDLVILDRLLVHPPFRGNKIGLYAMEMLRRITTGARLYALYAKPLQYVQDVRREARDKRADVKQLMDYYRQAGFEQLPSTKLMVLDPGVRRRSIQRPCEEKDIVLKRTEAMKTYLVPREGTQ